MPLDAATGQLFAPYRPGGRHGHQFWCKKSSCGVVKLLFEASVKKARNGPSTQPRLLITVLRRYCFWGQIHSIPGYWSIPQYSWSNLFQFCSCRGYKIVTVFSMKTVIFISVFTGITVLQYTCQSDSIPQYS